MPRHSVDVMSRQLVHPGPPSRRPSSTRHRTLSALDTEILRLLLRFGMARPHHVVAWTGASPHTIKRRLAALAGRGAVKSMLVTAALRGADGAVRETVCTVWTTTSAGAGYGGEWQVTGYDTPVTLPVARHSRQMAHHALGVVDLACWYRQHGFDVVAEREVRSREQRSTIAPDRVTERFWAVDIPGRPGVHPPDMGAVAPDGGVWAVELERAVKEVRDYQEVIAAYANAGMGQVWHIKSQATARRVMDACTRLGVQWAPPAAGGVTASADGLIRLQQWLPGRAGLRGPEQWTRQLPRSSPAGIPVPAEKPDLSATWRRGRVIDLNEDQLVGGVIW